jgi:beta-galactosidase
VDRTGDRTQIKVYSNQSEVTLFVDGKEAAKETGDRVFCFEIPLSGEHRIEAVSGSLKDTITIRKAEKANPEYTFGEAGEVVNWFDKEEIDPAYFSIKDKFGDLMKHPGTAAIVGKIMAKAQASRGDVAKSTSDNKVLQQMLAMMSFESLLRQAGANVVPPEMVRAINDMLQKVRKD